VTTSGGGRDQLSAIVPPRRRSYYATEAVIFVASVVVVMRYGFGAFIALHLCQLLAYGQGGQRGTDMALASRGLSTEHLPAALSRFERRLAQLEAVNRTLAQQETAQHELSLALADLAVLRMHRAILVDAVRNRSLAGSAPRAGGNDRRRPPWLRSRRGP
jgi:hypothetical protein